MRRLLTACTLMAITAVMPAHALHNQLLLTPATKVPMRHEVKGRFPAFFAAYQSRLGGVQEADGGCGVNVGIGPEGRELLVILGPGDETTWGPAVFYVVIDAAGTVLEWAGDPHACDPKI